MKCFGATDTGLVRKTNQDSYIIAYNEIGDVLALVCDGIGGGNSGDVASYQAISYISEVFQANNGFKDCTDIETFLKFHIRKANENIFSMSTTSKEYKGMGTTITGILISKIATYTINIGDSRVYGVINDTVKQLTIDHTLVNDLIKSGEITTEEAKNHPKKNYLTNALGIWATCNLDIKRINEKYKTYLVCSDGLYGYVEEHILNKVLLNKKLTLQNKSKLLMNQALMNGGFDNITEVLIQMEEGEGHD